jgi:hypothetical protein
MVEVVVVWKQTVGQAVRLAASQVQAKYWRERVERDRRLEGLAVEVLSALGEREAMIAGTDNDVRGGAVVCRSNQPSRSVPASPVWIERARSVRVPTLVIDSDVSPAHLRDAARAASSALPNARPHTVPGSFHDVPAEILAPVVAEFFGE